jgi:hypothetical protein
MGHVRFVSVHVRLRLRNGAYVAEHLIVRSLCVPRAFVHTATNSRISLPRSRNSRVLLGDPTNAVSLLEVGSDGRAYLLKQRVSEPEQLVGAIREVARGGSVIDPRSSRHWCLPGRVLPTRPWRT